MAVSCVTGEGGPHQVYMPQEMGLHIIFTIYAQSCQHLTQIRSSQNCQSLLLAILIRTITIILIFARLRYGLESLVVSELCNIRTISWDYAFATFSSPGGRWKAQLKNRELMLSQCVPGTKSCISHFTRDTQNPHYNP